LTGEEIALIIEASAKANVRVLELPGIRLEFGEASPAKVAVTPPAPAEPTRPTDAALSDEQHDKQNKEALEVEEARTKEHRLGMMLIEDPLEAERMIASGELDDEEEGGDEDEDF